jgi:hypothetical protein
MNRRNHLIPVVVAVCLLLVSAACLKISRSPTETMLGTHHVKVRPQCQGSSSRSVTKTEKDGTSRIVSYEFDCGDTRISIRDTTLSVNGKSYGTLNDNDSVAVDWGKVRVNSTVREEVR